MHYRILCLLQLWLQLFFLKQKVGNADYFEKLQWKKAVFVEREHSFTGVVISDLEHSPNLQTYFVTGLLRA